MAASKNPFGWTEIYVEDMARAQKFYETVLAVKLEPLPVPAGMDIDGEDSYEMVSFPGEMAAPGTSGALVKSSMFKPGLGGTLVYFSCEDCATEISRVVSAGGKLLNDKMSIGEYGFCGVGMDTEGNAIGFHSMK
ncbi:VOC family protein [Pedobacter sp. PLR]|uniref:VOC family protein n=1 Tax=Pedobacter sp. PLR TaxID=2994465 RepID=UPI002245C14C|nr:VOC family protein [Pedobacter sp. PLR]MCX2451425.1 VOC family protein [Pedobacter sp. PLR]